ncbi:class I SAM-dependent methyltransferase [Paenibacillus sp. FSL R7-0652]|uniref:Class I SAM-dependent methyltransferase n=1 Tax=Paenibacillus sp. AN1007 TaxID=3151385 RepID=A0AAU8N9C1_9BACL
MSMEWYDMIARRNGGYRGRARYIWEGKSAEEIFEERLIRMLPAYTSVMDAGCGHGDFTLKMAAYASHIIGFDNSKEMIRIAQQGLESSTVQNVNFVCAATKEELPFQDEQFDLIYNRRGPTSIIEYGRLLPPGGVLFGIHTDVTKVRERLERNRYEQIEIEEYRDACMVFPDETEFALFLADIPGSPDYTQPEYRELLQAKTKEHTLGGKITVQEHKFIWRAVKV